MSKQSGKSVVINGRIVQTKRNERLMTQAVLAERAGMSLNNIKRIEALPHLGVHAGSVQALADALEVDPRELLAPDGPKEFGVIRIDSPLHFDLAAQMPPGNNVSTMVNAALYQFLCLTPDSQLAWLRALRDVRVEHRDVDPDAVAYVAGRVPPGERLELYPPREILRSPHDKNFVARFDSEKSKTRGGMSPDSTPLARPAPLKAARTRPPAGGRTPKAYRGGEAPSK